MARLVIKITSGTEALERCNQGWTVATAAMAAGVETSVWLTGDAVWFATPGYADSVELEGAQSFSFAVAEILAQGTLTACTQCLRRRNIEPEQVLPGVRVAGAMGFVEEVMVPEAKALVY
ncbi:MAG: DsrE family protein [Candidatus Nanopelagicales bacterium]